MNTPTTNEEKITDAEASLAGRGKTLRKKRSSKLDRFATELQQMDKDKVTLPEIVNWLNQRGVSTTAKNVSLFLTNRREEHAIELLTQKFDSRAKKMEAIRHWLANHPQPDLGTMIEILKMLMMDLATKDGMDPQTVKLADKLTQTAIRFANDQGRADFRTRKLLMEEQKHAEWIKCEKSRALELCLAESNQHPEIAKMFRQAFNALRAIDSPKLRPEDGRQTVPASCVQATSPWAEPVASC